MADPDSATCDFCGRPAVILDGTVGARLCEWPECFNRAFDRAYEASAD